MSTHSTDNDHATTHEREILAAYRLGWCERAAVAADVGAGSIEASEADLLTAPPVDARALRARIAEEG